MRKEMERLYCPSEAVWDALRGKNIVFAGNRTQLRQRFMDNLAYISSQNEMDFTVSEWSGEIGPDDSVLLFGSAEGGIQALDEVLDVLKRLAQLAGGPQECETENREKSRRECLTPAAAFISDNRVYGKLYGAARSIREDELGFVCHTSEKDIPLQCLRTAEHFACRLARENGINIKVLRADDKCGGNALQYMIETAVEVLLRGAPGQAYNLPCGEHEAGQSGSPLSPIKIVTDTAKAEESAGRFWR